MLKRPALQKAAFAGVVAMTVLISACSSSDDDADPIIDTSTGTETAGGEETGGEEVIGGEETGGEQAGGGSQLNPNLETLSVLLDSSSTVPPANVDGASGEGSFSVDTSTGAFGGSVTVSGTSGAATAAHIHRGAAGVAGGVAVALEANEDSTVWSVPEGAALDAADIALFSAGELYVNVHTEANAAGELRSQLVDANVPAAGSVTISFRNTSATQPMTPPVVALHNAPGAENGIRFFEVGQPAIGEVIMIAEDGNFGPLLDVANGQITAGSVTAAGAAFTDPENPGPVLPGASASVTLQIEAPDQVMSIVSMVVCTNDGFSGVDSRPLSADASETFFAPIYDAGSETNVLTADYWVPPCGSPDNLGDDEGGAITAHPGQSGSENADFDFAPGTELLEVTVTRN